MDVEAPTPNPQIAEQQAQATANDTTQIQQSLGQDTQNLWNMFGNGSQLSYVQVPGAGVVPAAPATAVAMNGSHAGGPAGGGSGSGAA